MKMYHVKQALTLKFSFSDIIDYFRANYRYVLYYYPQLRWLMRPHIKDQIDYRIRAMDKQCYNDGSCKVCGCMTTHLQMANKACEGDCYPPMMAAKNWKAVRNMYYTDLFNKVAGNNQPTWKQWQMKDGIVQF